MTANVPAVLIACPGLGIVNRGFETFARECFEAFRERDDVNVALAKGRGPEGPGDSTARTISRDSALARAAGTIFRREPFVFEQLTFALTLVPVIRRERPDVILLSEWSLVRALGLIRSLTGLRYKLLLSNGAGAWPRFNPAVDHVQQLTPTGLAVALEGGEPASRHTVLPLGFAIEPRFGCPSEEERVALRARLSLPTDRPVLLSVSALNMWSKRLDYVIEEVAALPHPRPFLVLLGEREPETDRVLELAKSRLGADGFLARTVASDEVASYYWAADLFALASTAEGMGRALVESLTHGLPTLAHDYPIANFVLGPHGLTADLSKRGALSALIQSISPDELEPKRREARHRYAYEHFSWDKLAPRYVELFRACASGGGPRPPAGFSSPSARLSVNRCG